MAKKHGIYLALAVLIVSAPAFLSFLYIYNFGVNVAYYDQWKYLRLVEKLFTHQLVLRDFFELDSIHLVTTSKLVSLISAYTTRWNTMTELWVGYFLQLATCVIVFGIYWSKRGNKTNLPLEVLAFLPFTMIIFSLRQWENLLGIWSVQWFGVNCFVLLTLFLLETTSYRRFVLAILSAIMASLTFSHGFLAWPLGLLIMFSGLLHRSITATSARKIKLQISIWSLITFGLVLSRLIVYRLGSPKQSPGGIGVGVMAQRFFLALSGPLAFDKEITAAGVSVVQHFDIEFMILLSLVLAALFLALLYALRHRESFIENRLHLAVSLFGLGSAALVAFGRSSEGVQQALSPRYTTACSMFLIGLLLLLRSLIIKDARMRIPLVSLITLIFFTNVYAGLSEWNMGKYRRANLVQWSNTIRNYQSVPDEQLKTRYRTAQEIRDLCRIMERYRLNAFSEEQPGGEE